LKKPFTKRVGGVAQGVGLSSSSHTEKKKKNGDLWALALLVMMNRDNLAYGGRET
jgi:hypothetical protein